MRNIKFKKALSKQNTHISEESVLVIIEIKTSLIWRSLLSRVCWKKRISNNMSVFFKVVGGTNSFPRKGKMNFETSVWRQQFHKFIWV